MGLSPLPPRLVTSLTVPSSTVANLNQRLGHVPELSKFLATSNLPRSLASSLPQNTQQILNNIRQSATTEAFINSRLPIQKEQPSTPEKPKRETILNFDDDDDPIPSTTTTTTTTTSSSITTTMRATSTEADNHNSLEAPPLLHNDKHVDGGLAFDDEKSFDEPLSLASDDQDTSSPVQYQADNAIHSEDSNPIPISPEAFNPPPPQDSTPPDTGEHQPRQQDNVDSSSLVDSFLLLDSQPTT